MACKKKRHDNLERATAAMGRLYRSGATEYGTLNVYRCGKCGGYHVGHKRFRSKISPFLWNLIKEKADE